MIRVNGVAIDQEAIGRELQYHPAASREEAEASAARALAVRELLVQRARELGLDADDDSALEALVAGEVAVPEPSEEEIARYHRRNWVRFRTPPLWEAAHIFFPAREEDEAARDEARAKAEAVLAELLAAPSRFAELARTHSACASAAAGGALGQVTRGDTNPELERALAAMDPGTIHPAPVATRHGFHVLRLDRSDNGRELALEEVRERIAAYLRQSARRRAVSQYLRLLAGRAEIHGIALDGADSPLVQ